MQRQIGKNEHDGHLINISGRQRMLSQRIALLSRELALARGEVAPLADAVETMRSAHAELMTYHYPPTGSVHASSTLHALYRGDGGVDGRVSDYLTQADALIDAAIQGPAGQDDLTPMADAVVSTSQDGLLGRLDAVVQQYELESAQKTRTFRRLELLMLAVGLSVLVLEVLFLFRPMVLLVERTFGSLEQANEELRQFSYRISHDLRAPISSSLGLVAVARTQLKKGNTSAGMQALMLIGESMQRLDGLITDVVAFMRSRTEDEAEQEVVLAEMLDDVVASLEHMDGFGTVMLQVRCSVERPIRTKALLLRQSLENLVSNAVKYQDPDKADSFVRIEAGLNGTDCHIAVIDNGLGVPDVYRGELFGLFKRFHTQVSAGSGLGLYLVAQNASQLGGSAHYTPLDDGSRFAVIFPTR